MLVAANLAALVMTFSAPTVQEPSFPCEWNPPTPVIPPDCHSVEVNVALQAFFAELEQAESDCRACKLAANTAYDACVQQWAGTPWYIMQPDCTFNWRLATMVCSLDAGSAVVAAILEVNAAIEAACP